MPLAMRSSCILATRPQRIHGRLPARIAALRSSIALRPHEVIDPDPVDRTRAAVTVLPATGVPALGHPGMTVPLDTHVTVLPGSAAPGQQPTGNNLFRPSPSELAVHEVARVGPWFQDRDAGTDAISFLFANMYPHDRICFIIRQERFRSRQYHTTNVTTKILFWVDFSVGPSIMSCLSDAPGAYHQDRTVVHEDSQWGGLEPASVVPISLAD
ncbi:hypothetical protein PHYPSEUDO_006377 [Phytophthora pseudosyringae]|uniref:Uncharacterized protein n=1 Tax=Phytophthora pseudosyringae TaxID=221518 RepID=A0A8T1WFV0_9STRA|nr:hypothetical protein PHYPSEUDO_006377 [Phytophthora pseudosyringae]